MGTYFKLVRLDAIDDEGLSTTGAPTSLTPDSHTGLTRDVCHTDGLHTDGLHTGLPHGTHTGLLSSSSTWRIEARYAIVHGSVVPPPAEVDRCNKRPTRSYQDQAIGSRFHEEKGYAHPLELTQYVTIFLDQSEA